MLNIFIKLDVPKQIDDRVVLTFDSRQKSRLRVTLVSGEDAALFLERGNILRGGDLLEAEDGKVIEVVAAKQQVMKVTADSHETLMKAAYHLGNRHVPLEVGNGWLLLEQDHVLKEMLIGLGVSVSDEELPFEPEAGAYGGGHRHHDDSGSPSIRPPSRILKNAR